MHKLGNDSMTANDQRNEIKAVLTARRNLYNAGVALLECNNVYASNIKFALERLTLKRIDARSNVNDSAKAVVLCEFLFFSLQSPHLCNMKQKGHQNAAFGCFVLMPFYDIVSFTAATTITGIPSSLSATLHSF